MLGFNPCAAEAVYIRFQAYVSVYTVGSIEIFPWKQTWFSYTKGFRMRISMKLVYQYIVIFLNF